MSSLISRDREDNLVYWTVAASAIPYNDTHLRHAIRRNPGAFPALTTVTAVCGERIKIPTPTPYDAEPRTAVVQRCCAACTEIVTTEELDQHRWDC